MKNFFFLAALHFSSLMAPFSVEAQDAFTGAANITTTNTNLTNNSSLIDKIVGGWKISVYKDAALGINRLDVETVTKTSSKQTNKLTTGQNNKLTNQQTNQQTSQQTKLMTYSAPLPHDELIDTAVVELRGYKRPLLVTIWNTGVHSQQLVIFDPTLKTKALMSSIYSVLTITYTVNKDHLDIEFYEEATPRTPTTTKWMPGVKVGLTEEP